MSRELLLVLKRPQGRGPVWWPVSAPAGGVWAGRPQGVSGLWCLASRRLSH